MNHEGDLTPPQPEPVPGAVSQPPPALSSSPSWFPRYRLAVFSAAGVVLVGAIAVAAVLAVAKPNPSIEKMVPATHDVLLIANLNPSLAQKVNLLRAVHSFPDTETDADNKANPVTLKIAATLVPDATGCAGKFQGDRAQGDMLLSVDFLSGGTLGSSQLYIWDCNADPNITKANPTPTPNPQPAVGFVCNPPSHGQSVPHYFPISSSAVNFGVNDAGPVPCGGWACRNADGTRNLNIATNELMEGGIEPLRRDPARPGPRRSA